MKKTEIRIKVGNGVVNRYEVDKFDKRSKADCEMMGKLEKVPSDYYYRDMN